MSKLTQLSHESSGVKILRAIAAIGFIAAGANHFVKPGFYRQIVPPGFSAPAALVAISGVAEIAGGAGLLVRPLRRLAGFGLIALLIAVFPANIYMALAPRRAPASNFPEWALWLRLPIQALIGAWVWYVAIDRSRAGFPERPVRDSNAL